MKFSSVKPLVLPHWWKESRHPSMASLWSETFWSSSSSSSSSSSPEKCFHHWAEWLPPWPCGTRGTLCHPTMPGWLNSWTTIIIIILIILTIPTTTLGERWVTVACPLCTVEATFPLHPCYISYHIMLMIFMLIGMMVVVVSYGNWYDGHDSQWLDNGLTLSRWNSRGSWISGDTSVSHSLSDKVTY